MSDFLAVAGPALGALGLVLAAAIPAAVQLRKSRSEGVRARHMHQQDHDLARDAHDLTVLREGIDFLREEVVRLRAVRDEDRADLARQRERIEGLEISHSRLADENRTFRAVILGVMERLRRRPPDEPESILAYILTHLPHFGKDQS